jgi:hypothetical protein
VKDFGDIQLMDIIVVFESKEIFWYGLLASWGGQVPAVFLCTRYWRSDLTGLYTGMSIGYGVLVGLYSLIAFTR